MVGNTGIGLVTPSVSGEALRRASWHDPPGGLLGEAGDGVEVAVIVQDLKPMSTGGRRDEKIGD